MKFENVLLLFVVVLSVVIDINADSLSVTSPAIGQQLQQGQQFQIQWQNANGDSVNLYVEKDGDSLATVDTTAVPNTGTYQAHAKWLWGLGDDFRIILTDGDSMIAKSDSFSIFETNIELQQSTLDRGSYGSP